MFRRIREKKDLFINKQKMKAMNQILAWLLDNFKTKSPQGFMILQVVIWSLYGIYTQLEGQMSIDLPDWVGQLLFALTAALSALTGSRTFDFKPKEVQVEELKQKKAEGKEIIKV
jgi:hypothetical protein